MGKLSSYPADASPTMDDLLPIIDGVSKLNKKIILTDLNDTIYDNIPAGADSYVTRWDESFYDFVQSGCIWTGDSYTSTTAGSMTAGVLYMDGMRVLVGAAISNVFTVSKDTYVDVLNNGDGTGTLVFTEVSNNLTSPALAANSIRIAIIVTNASSINSLASINQGQEGKLLPILASNAVMTTDRNGNIIYNASPTPRTLGYNQSIVAWSQVSASLFAMDGSRIWIIVPTGRKIKLTGYAGGMRLQTAAAGTNLTFSIFEDNLTMIACSTPKEPVTSFVIGCYVEHVYTPTAGLHQYSLGVSGNDASRTFDILNGTPGLTSRGPGFLKAELV